MRRYTVSQVARMAGCSVRTLHHYDQIGLLEPQTRNEAGYRLYGEQALLRLQQILFFKELDMPLSKVRQILDDPGFDQVEALEHHRQMLRGRMERLAQLLKTIDRTMERLLEDDMTLTDEDLYRGFSPEKAERYRQEAREMFGPDVVEASERKAKKMNREQWEAVGAEGGAVAEALAALAERDPGDAEVQSQIARHHAWIVNFYACPAERYRGLGQLYVEHPEFRAFYDKFRPGLAEFVAEAMNLYADRVLDKGE